MVKDEIEEGSKGTETPLRAYARASSGKIPASFPPEASQDDGTLAQVYIKVNKNH